MKNYKRNINIVWERVGDGLVAVNGDKGEIYEFNETAEFIWKILKTEKSYKEVFDLFCQEYDDVCDGQLKESVKTMVERGLLLKSG